MRTARQQLSALIYSKEENTRKVDFTFIVDDSATYHSLNDFRSAEARQQFQLLQQKEKDLESLTGQLDQKREAYAQAAESSRANMAPGMLDMEKRVEQLRQDVEELTNKVRNTEISQLRR